MLEHMDEFKVQTFEQKEHPTPDQVEQNKSKWGLK